MLRVDADFIGGNVHNVSFPRPDVIEFEAAANASPQTLWYAFRIRGGKGRRLTLVQRGLEHVLGVSESRGYAPVVPVTREAGGDWRRVAQEDIRSGEAPPSFSYTVTPATDTCYVAFCYPYQYADWQKFSGTLPGSVARIDELGKTMEGRPFTRLLLGYPKADTVRQIVYVTARQHAGEVSGSYVLEGFLDRLTRPDMKAVLDGTLFCVFPMADLDSVEEGRYGKDRYPVDFNRDWTRHAYHPEIELMKAEMEKLAVKYRPVWLLDLHAPQPGAASYAVPNNAYSQGSRQWNQSQNLAIAYEDACRGKVSFFLHDVDTEVLNWAGKSEPCMQNYYMRARCQCPVNCFEYSYHKDRDMAVLSRETWRGMGALLAEALRPFLLEYELSFRPPLLDRIPAWSVPEPLAHWQAIRKVKNIGIREQRSEITFTPESGQNAAMVTSPVMPPVGPGTPVAALEAAEDCMVETYFTFFEDGLVVKQTQSAYASFRGACVIEMPDDAGGRDWTLSARVRDIAGPVTVRLQSHD